MMFFISIIIKSTTLNNDNLVIFYLANYSVRFINTPAPIALFIA
jgi:hypothetical protein